MPSGASTPGARVALFGAIDRFNYGDLLFPIIFRHLLREQAGGRTPPPAVECVGFRRSRLTGTGGMPTRPLRWMLRPGSLPAGSSVIVVGGEVLAAPWGALAGHLLPSGAGDTLMAALRRRLSEDRLDALARRLVGGRWPVPFAIEPDHFPVPVRTAFQAVGGSGLADRTPAWRADVARALGKAVFASVRDRRTASLLREHAVDSPVAPDSAALVAECFPRDTHRNTLPLHPEVRAFLDDHAGRFVCFQTHQWIGSKRRRTYAAQLDTLADRHGWPIALLPIGHAAGHSDRNPLEEIRTRMRHRAFLPARLGVFDILTLLAHARIYAGSSLHGAITAMAYGVPYAGLTKVPKLTAYLDTWAPEPFRPTVEADTLADTLADRCRQHADLLAGESLRLARLARAMAADLIATTTPEAAG